MLTAVKLDEYETMDEVLESLATYAAKHPELPWITGRGWRYELVPKGTFPTAAMLDGIISDRPVFLRSYDGHAGWANSKALALASLDEAHEGVVRDAEGRATGALLEGAMDLVRDHIPEPSKEEKLERLARAAQHVARLGVTTVGDITGDLETLALYDELDRAGRLPVRVSVAFPLEGDLDAYVALRKKYETPKLRLGFLKAFVDGVVESKTAFMVDPYVDDTKIGAPLIERERLFELVREAHERRFTVALHAIGDGAVRLALDAYAAAQGEDRSRRHRIEHIEVGNAADYDRFAALGVVASMQPYHATPGDEPTGVWYANLGPARWPHTMPWASLAAAGATLAFGSDWPVMSADPLAGVAVAATRTNARGLPEGGFFTEQALSVGDAITAYTAGSAFALHREDALGRIERGYLADLVVLRPGIELTDPEQLRAGDRVAKVLVGGAVTYDAAR